MTDELERLRESRDAWRLQAMREHDDAEQLRAGDRDWLLRRLVLVLVALNVMQALLLTVVVLT